MLASNESPVPAGGGRRGGRARGRRRASTAIRTRARGALRRGARRPLRLPDRRASRSATAPARSCSPRRRRCSSRGARSSTPGRRSRCIRTWRRSTGREGGDACRSTDGYVHDLDAMAARDHRAARGWCSSATPTTRPAPTSPATRSARSSSDVPPRVLVILDEAYIEFQTVEDPDTSLDLLRALPQPRDAAHLLEGLRPRGAAGRLRARHRGVPGGGRPRAPAVLRQPPGAGGRDRGAAPPGRRRPAGRVERRRAALDGGGAGASWASRSPTARPTSAGSRSASATSARSSRALPRAGVAVRPGQGLGGPGYLRVTYGTRAENERFIEALRGALEDG